MPKKRIVLDTNCLIASLSRRGQYYPVWKGLQDGAYTLCVSNDILDEYAEIISQKMSAQVAANVIHLLLESNNVELVTPYFSLHLIEADHDDDKFVDCAFDVTEGLSCYTFVILYHKSPFCVQVLSRLNFLHCQYRPEVCICESSPNHQFDRFVVIK